MSSEKSKTVYDTLRTWFSIYGASEELSSDERQPFDTCSLRIGEYGNVLCRLKIHKAGQK